MRELHSIFPWYLSLRWKTTIFILTVFTATSFLLFGWFNSRVETGFYDNLQNKRQADINLLTERLQLSSTSLQKLANSVLDGNIADEHPLTANLSNTQSAASLLTLLTPKTIKRTDDTSTQNSIFLAKLLSLHNSKQVQSVSIFDLRDKKVWTTNNSESTQLIPDITTQVKISQKPRQGIYCDKQCLHYLIAPLNINNKIMGTIHFTQSIDITLKSFSKTNNMMTGLIRLQKQNYEQNHTNGKTAIPPWQAELVSLQNSKTTRPLLDHISNQFDYNHLNRFSERTYFNEKYFSTTLYTLPDQLNDQYQLVLIRNTTSDEFWIKTLLIEQFYTYVAIAIILISLFIIIIWRSVKKLNLINQYFTLLEEKKFEHAHNLIKPGFPPLLNDELRTLEASVRSFASQLESLNNTIGMRNQEMERLSLFDPLTGLANRNLLYYEAERDAQRINQSKELTAVVLLDLDKFKRINDSLGHEQGDLLLVKIGERLKKATRKSGTVARLGGDEFAILLRSIKNTPQLSLIGEKIVSLIHQPVTLEKNPIVVSCSVGISVISQRESIHDLLKHAEIAMYKSKNLGGNGFQLYDSRMAEENTNILSLESELRRALKNSEFTLYLQPKVNMESDIEGFESLVRWDHPDKGILPPSEFIPAMESMGLISELDNWVLEASCRQLKTWTSLYPDISLAVNISSTHFTEQNFLVFLQQCLEKYPIDPSRLELEITETLLMENMNAGMEIINQIKSLGVSIAIDDFGTGYSSLSYLKRLPVDILKIDREFIKDIPDSSSDMQISSVIIFLARQLNFKVVAEGVETMDQLLFLQSNQCDLAQGFYFSKPIPAHKAMILLESQRLIE